MLEVKIFAARSEGVCDICGAHYFIDDDVARLDEWSGITPAGEPIHVGRLVHAECAWAMELDS